MNSPRRSVWVPDFVELPRADFQLVNAMGGIGLGLVWGWLLVLVVKPDRKRVIAFFEIAAATTLVAVEVAAMAGSRSLLFFIGAMVLAALLHFAWVLELKARFGSRG